VAAALPELIPSVSGLRNGGVGIPLGTLMGNITNPLMPGPLVLDLPWGAVTGALLWTILWFSKGKLGKAGAVYLIALYGVYVASRTLLFAVD